MTSKIPICASCVGMDLFNPVLSSDTKIPKWLENVNYVKDFIAKQKSFEITKPKKNTFKVSFTVEKKYAGQFVLYWAAKPSTNNFKIADAKSSYDKFQNSGVAKVTNKGILEMYVQCPQNYKAISSGSKIEKTFHRHIHFCFQKRNEKKWNEKKIFTKIITCDVDLQFKDQQFCVKNKNKCVFGEMLLCTLPFSFYKKNHIPESFHLDAAMVQKMSRQNLKTYFMNIIEKNKQQFAKLKKAIDKKDVEWYAIPIILYCKNKTCKASDHCLEELTKKGIVNIKIFRGGIDEYHNEINV